MAPGKKDPEEAVSQPVADEATVETVAAPVTLDVNQLANILTQARGPIIDRLERAMPKLSGDGSVDVTEWLTAFEKRCKAELSSPADFIDFMLTGNASRVYRRMMVSEASQWQVVRSTLLAEYALPRQEAWRQFTGRRLVGGEPVDVYADDLARLGTRVGLTPADLAFVVKFYEGLPMAVYEWAVSRDDAYTAGFSIVLSAVRARISAKKAAAGRDRGADFEVAAASGNQHGISCYRCGGPHGVKACPGKRRKLDGPSGRSTRAPQGGSGNCFRCGRHGHYVRTCPVAAASGSGFHQEGVAWGAPSSSMEIDAE